MAVSGPATAPWPCPACAPTRSAGAAAAGITLLELTAQQASLEEAFVDLTQDAVEFRAPTRRSTV